VLPKGHVRIAPDLAVEVVSPRDLAPELDEKLEDYRKAGVRLVWVISPESRTVTIYRGDGSVSRLHEDDVLSGEDVIPGFRCEVRSPFPPRATADAREAGTGSEPKGSGIEG
jgi:Uma2 family endonuclease